jgi:hypothetical protein
LRWPPRALLLVAVFAPALAQPPHAHDFADQRALWGLPHALDVLSNLPFAIAGVLGLARAAPACPRRSRMRNALARACSSPACSWWPPARPGTTWRPTTWGSRSIAPAMSVAFAGLLGLLVASRRVSERAGRRDGATRCSCWRPASVLGLVRGGNVLPWALVQFGGMPLLLGWRCPRARASGLPCAGAWCCWPTRWPSCFELNDHAIYEATGELLSGHTLKHVAAALAAWPVIHARCARWQNAQQNEFALRHPRARRLTTQGEE